MQAPAALCPLYVFVVSLLVRLSIRYQLLVPLLTLLLGVIGMSTWTALASAARARQQIDTQVNGIIATLQQSKFTINRRVLELMKGFSGADFYYTDPKNQWTTLPSSDVELPYDLLHTSDAGTLSRGQRVSVAGNTYLCSGVRLENAGGELYIFYPESLWRDALWEAVRPSLLFGVFGGLASIVLTFVLGQRLSGRILNLEKRTRLIAAGDFSPMPLPRRNDELRDLGQSINEMAQRLAQLQDTMRKTEQMRLLGQVSGGLAHQLRNGVTGARLAVQLHARDCATDAEPLQVALRQLGLVEMHLKRFLSLGRTGDFRPERCSLTKMVGEAVTLVQPQCKHAAIGMTWQPPPEELAVRGDAGQLSQVLLNVLTNAIEAAGPGGKVEVCARQDEQRRAVVQVRDSGPGPSADVAGRLFEPFVTGKPDGVGLGLAVARQVIAGHGGGLRWQRRDGWTCFEIDLPLESIT
jgi:signal transduction histidine kinase